uniref:Putative ribosomal-protein-alanine acetyltransferase n=1 Tax=Paulinella chromatophora TaxID=39717 RepID=B1X5I8_PAUCH|nr:putative ribosomal-protein-alanine acetyltransferase [Paulinella chromatophora]ACB43207.1 putative ribosomal-protein-alanine acetyltransferase [Paulinella chromatophora]
MNTLHLNAIIVRSLGPHDYLNCIKLDNETLGGLWSESQWIQELEDMNRPCIGIWTKGKLLAIGCGWMVADELHITMITVAIHRQRAGLGYQIISILLNQGRILGAKHATLEVNAKNHVAIQLYKKIGFLIAGDRSAYYKKNENAIIHWLKL